MNRHFLKIFCFLALGTASIVNAQEVQGYGNNVPLQGVLSDIVPYGYNVSYGSGVDKDIHINWQGGSDWNTVVQNIASQNGLKASISGHKVMFTLPNVPSTSVVSDARSKREIQLASTPPVAPPVVNLPQVNSKVDSNISTVSSPIYTPSARSALHLHQGNGHLWHASNGQTVNEILNNWADQAGWTVSFKSKEKYEIQASADFDGDFMSASTALLKSIHVEPRFKAVFHTGNNVLVVGNSFSQVK